VAPVVERRRVLMLFSERRVRRGGVVRRGASGLIDAARFGVDASFTPDAWVRTDLKLGGVIYHP
jgi:hypothetical protein